MSDFTDKLVQFCFDEWGRFGNQRYDRRGRKTRTGHSETGSGFWERIGEYWHFLGFDIDGLDTHWAWSAAFISFAMSEAGASRFFPYSLRHSDYINESIRSRQTGVSSYNLKGYPVTERSPQLGDLVGYARQSGVSFETALDYEGYKSHVDIVVQRGTDYVDVIGGNVGDSVSMRRFSLDANGLINDPTRAWFVAMATEFE